MPKKFIPIFLFVAIIAILFLNGCIRLWGGATYVRAKPGDYEEKTYAVDTAELLNKSQKNIQS